MNNQQNTVQGTINEHLFANSIFDHQEAWGAILDSIGCGNLKNVAAKAQIIGGNKRKGDVEINFESQAAPIRATVKSFNVGYNHLERRNLRVFCERNQISKADADFLEKIWLRKARNSGQGLLVEDNERARVKRIFEPIEPGVSAVLGNDHPQIMVLFHTPSSKFYLYNVQTQVLPLIRGQEVGFTSKSSNIELGSYIVVQRKGSMQGESGTDPYHIDHGSNHVQIKMKVGTFIRKVAPVTWYQL